MKRFLAVCGGLLAVLLLAVGVRAEEVKNEFFILDLPSGWTVTQNPAAEGRCRVAVRNNAEKVVVAIAISKLPGTASLDELFSPISRQLEAGGLTVGEAKTSGNTRMAEFSRAGKKGNMYVTANGTHFSVISIFGETDKPGKTLLQENFKPVDPRLFPASY